MRSTQRHKTNGKQGANKSHPLKLTNGKTAGTSCRSVSFSTFDSLSNQAGREKVGRRENNNAVHITALCPQPSNSRREPLLQHPPQENYHVKQRESLSGIRRRIFALCCSKPAPRREKSPCDTKSHHRLELICTFPSGFRTKARVNLPLVYSVAVQSSAL